VKLGDATDARELPAHAGTCTVFLAAKNNLRRSDNTPAHLHSVKNAHFLSDNP
jgi:hypothetical protein